MADINLKHLLAMATISNTTNTTYNDALTAFQNAYAGESFGTDKDQRLIFAQWNGKGTSFYANGVLYDIYGNRLKSAASTLNGATATESATGTYTYTTTYTLEDNSTSTSSFQIALGDGIKGAVAGNVLTMSVTRTGVSSANWSSLTDISESFQTVITNNALADGENLTETTNKLDAKILGLALEVVANEAACAAALQSLRTIIGLEENFSIPTSSTYVAGQTNIVTAIDALESRLQSVESLPTFDVVVLGDAELPTASADTYHKIYLKTATGTGAQNVYKEYITVRSGNEGAYTYSWELIGDTAIDLTGYLKTVTVNGKAYSNASGSSIDLGEIVNKVESGNSNQLTATSNVADGVNTVTITPVTATVTQAEDTLSSDSDVALLKGDAIAKIKAYVDDQVKIIWEAISL